MRPDLSRPSVRFHFSEKVESVNSLAASGTCACVSRLERSSGVIVASEVNANQRALACFWGHWRGFAKFSLETEVLVAIFYMNNNLVLQFSERKRSVFQFVSLDSTRRKGIRAQGCQVICCQIPVLLVVLRSHIQTSTVCIRSRRTGHTSVYTASPRTSGFTFDVCTRSQNIQPLQSRDWFSYPFLNAPWTGSFHFHRSSNSSRPLSKLSKHSEFGQVSDSFYECVSPSSILLDPPHIPMSAIRRTDNSPVCCLSVPTLFVANS